MNEEVFTVFVERSFEAAHSLGMLPPTHKCHGVHGHHYTIRVYCTGPVDDRGFVIDYGDIKEALDPLIDRVDHSYLNKELEMEQPSTENLSRWFWAELCLHIGHVLDHIEIRETNSNGCIYKGW